MNRMVVVACLLLSTGALAAERPAHVEHPPPPPAPVDLDKPLTGVTLRKLNMIMSAQAATLTAQCQNPVAQGELQALIKQATPSGKP